MPVGVTDLTALKTLDIKPPAVRAQRTPGDNSFDRVLDRQRQANEKSKPADPPKPEDAAKPDDKTKAKDDVKKSATGKKDTKKTGDAEDTDTDGESVENGSDASHVKKSTTADGDHPESTDNESGDEVKADKEQPGVHAKDAADTISPDAAAAAAAAQQTATNPAAAATSTATDTAVDAVATTTTAQATTGNATKETAAAKKSDGPQGKPAEALDSEKEVQPDTKKGKIALQAVTADADGDAGQSAAEDTAEDAKPATKSAAPQSAAPDPAVVIPTVAHAKTSAPAAIQQTATTVAPERAVAANNVERIVTSVRGNLGAAGGTMQIRLDPPTLGAVNVSVSFDNGVMTASIQTENEQATRMLSHSLGDLKTSLESAGVNVDKIQVKQAAPSEHSSNQQQSSDQQSKEQSSYDDSSRQEQQRREALQRMWRRLSIGTDDLDLVA